MRLSESLSSEATPAAVEPPVPAWHDRRVARVLRHVMQDLTKRTTCASAARIAGLERGYFSKRFRCVMRVSFTHWNARVRIDEAKRLLKAIDLSITAISASVGYDDVTTFERAFRRVEGICPREYRRRAKAGVSRETRNAESATPNAETVHATRA
jgi:transcriptional regulator GlxA family with amidase domain